MNAIDIIRRLAATASRIEKEQILVDAFMAGNREFFVGAQYAYDCLVTFGVKQVPLIDDDDDGEPGTVGFSDFLILCDKLRRRALTGKAAKGAMHAAANRSHVATWNEFYRRVLLKDLKIGCEVKTINKVLEKLGSAYPEARSLMIPVFACQLAHDGAKPEHEKKIKGRRLLDVKLDGVRLLTVLDKEMGTVTQYTRNGKINENFSEIRECLGGLLVNLPGSVVLDGEVVAASFQELMTQVNRREGVDTEAAKLAVFDIVPLADFKRGKCDIPQEDRHAILTELEQSGAFAEHCGKRVYVIPKVEVDLSTEEGCRRYEEFNRQAIEAGFEGIMIKDPASPYECKRSVAWLKRKPTISVTLEIVGIEEGKADGKYVGMTGALVCRGEDDGRLIEVNVGSGLSDEQRKDFWARKAEIIGMMAEIEADVLTLEAGAEVYSLRFPRFKGFRGTVKGEKL